jgi:hypothetical protein
MAWRPLILGGLASLVGAFAATAADPPASFTGEVVTVDALGIHLVDRAGKLFVIDNPQRLRLKRGTMITVEGDLLAVEPIGPEHRFEGHRFTILQEKPTAPLRPFPGESFSADGNAPILLKGAVTSVEWRPVIRLHLAVEEPGKPAQPWLVELADPSPIMRIGHGPETVKAGVRLIIRGYQSVDKACAPECRALARDISVPDGRKVYMISSGTGAPIDGADAPH